MSWRSEMEFLIAEVMDLAWEQRQKRWGHDLGLGRAAGMLNIVEHDLFSHFINPLRNRMAWLLTGDRAEFQIIINGLHDNIDLEPVSDAHAAGRDYGSYPGVSDNIAAVKDRDIHLAINNLGTWNSPTAVAFRDGYLASLIEIAGAQLEMVQELGRVTRAYQKVLVDGQRALKRMVNATKEALDSYDPYSERGDPASADLIWTVIGAVKSVASGGLVDGAQAMVGYFVSGLAGSGEGTVERESEISGGSVEEILASMGDALTQLEQDILEEEQRISTALNNDLQVFAGGGIDHFRPREQVATDNFENPAVEETVVDITQLYHVGYVDMSAAAYDFDAARSRLGMCTAHENQAFGQWFGQSRAMWGEMCQKLESDILVYCRDHLVRHGDLLCQVASNYAEADGIAARDIHNSVVEARELLQAQDERYQTLNDPAPQAVPRGGAF